jgi:hypothetical protein
MFLRDILVFESLEGHRFGRLVARNGQRPANLCLRNSKLASVHSPRGVF